MCAVGGNVGASFTYGFAILPILFLGIGSSSPGIIVALVNLFKVRLDPDFRDRYTMTYNILCIYIYSILY
jgi:hypothetical protein